MKKGVKDSFSAIHVFDLIESGVEVGFKRGCHHESKMFKTRFTKKFDDISVGSKVFWDQFTNMIIKKESNR